MYSEIICEILETRTVFRKSASDEIFYLIDLKFDENTIVPAVCSEFILGDSKGTHKLSTTIKSEKGDNDKLFTYLDIHCINSSEVKEISNKFQIRGYVTPTKGLGVANQQGTIYRFIMKYYNHDTSTKSIVHCIAIGELARRIYFNFEKNVDNIFTLEGLIKNRSGKIEMEITSIINIKQAKGEVV